MITTFNRTDYQRADSAILESLKAKLSTRQLVEVTNLEATARGYVWGFEDRSGDRVSEFVASWDFPILYAIEAARYLLDQASTRPTIQDAWQCWLAGHEINSHGLRYCEI